MIFLFHALWPLPTISLVLAVLIPGAWPFFSIMAVMLWIYAILRRIKAKRPTRSYPQPTSNPQPAAFPPSPRLSPQSINYDRLQVEAMLNNGRGLVTREEYFGPHDQIAYEVVEARFQELGGTPNTLTDQDWAELVATIRFFISGEKGFLDRAPDPSKALARYPEYFAAKSAVAQAIKKRSTKARKTQQDKPAAKQKKSRPDIRSFAGPDIILWHQIATETHDFDALENDIWWILEQKECDQATVAEFLLGFILFELLENAAKTKNEARLANYRSTVQRWTIGYYTHRCIGPQMLQTQPNTTYEGILQETQRLRQSFGADIPDLPPDIFSPFGPQTARPEWHVPSGWAYASTIGFTRVSGEANEA